MPDPPSWNWLFFLVIPNSWGYQPRNSPFLHAAATPVEILLTQLWQAVPVPCVSNPE